MLLQHDLDQRQDSYGEFPHRRLTFYRHKPRRPKESLAFLRNPQFHSIFSTSATTIATVKTAHVTIQVTTQWILSTKFSQFWNHKIAALPPSSRERGELVASLLNTHTHRQPTRLSQDISTTQTLAPHKITNPLGEQWRS